MCIMSVVTVHVPIKPTISWSVDIREQTEMFNQNNGVHCKQSYFMPIHHPDMGMAGLKDLKNNPQRHHSHTHFNKKVML